MSKVSQLIAELNSKPYPNGEKYRRMKALAFELEAELEVRDREDMEFHCGLDAYSLYGARNEE